jgi:hypothetical protein
MTERTSDRKDLAAVLAFISGAIVIVASLGSLVLTLFAHYRHSYLIVDNDPERVATSPVGEAT